jgi:hypothetical protein
MTMNNRDDAVEHLLEGLQQARQLKEQGQYPAALGVLEGRVELALASLGFRDASSEGWNQPG